MLQDKYKINTYLQDKYPHDPGGRDICEIKQYLEKLYVNVNMLFNHKLPTNLYFIRNYQVIDQARESKLDTQPRIHIYISIIHQERENWINYTMKYNLQSF